MGLGASQARYLLLTAWKSDLELRGQQINGQRLLIATQSADAMMAYSTALTDAALSDTQQAAAEAAYEGRVADIQVVDKILELELKNIDTQHQAVQTEVDAVKKVIDKNIEKSFKTFST